MMAVKLAEVRARGGTFSKRHLPPKKSQTDTPRIVNSTFESINYNKIMRIILYSTIFFFCYLDSDVATNVRVSAMTRALFIVCKHFFFFFSDQEPWFNSV